MMRTHGQSPVGQASGVALATPKAIDASRQHQGLPVHGYRPQNDAAVKAVNANKLVEEHLLRQLDLMVGDSDIDQRWLAVARTHFEQGFMALNRAVFRPARITLPEDDDGA